MIRAHLICVPTGGSNKAWPVYPEKDGADHGEQVRMVYGLSVFVFEGSRCAEHERCSEPKVGTK